LRVFIAIEFQEEVKNYLKEIQDLISRKSEKGNFTIKDNFHLTLKFIGEVDLELVEKIKKAIDETVENHNNFKLYFNKIGKFSRASKSIIWMGLKREEELYSLYDKIERELEKINIRKEERKYTPHITLGREIILKEDFNTLLKEVKIKKLPILVDKVSLMESTRVNGELKYIPLYEKSLK